MPEEKLRTALPGVRSHITRVDVTASQRGRLLDAVTQSVADKGYAATTVADIVTLAGVSRTTFYQHFRDKKECFLEAYQSGFDEAIARLNDDALAYEGWIDRLRAGNASLLATLARAPDFARAFFVEVLAAGPEALERRDAIMCQFANVIAGNFQRARAELPELAEIPQLVLDTLVGGLTELIAISVRARRFDELAGLEPDMTRFILSVLFGDQAAAAALADHGD
jgi:AcrR family transcriptional regulator